MRLRFGDVTFDGGRRLVLRGPQAVHLTPKAFALLELLLSRRPDAVAKQEIYDVLWPRTFVSETNLPALVNEVRRAIGDRGKACSFVRTVHAYGYAFCGTAVALPELETPPKHRLVWGMSDLGLPEGESVLGRDRTVELRVAHPSVSRRHARLRVAGDTVEIEDLASKNGTYVGRRRADAPTMLRDGDEVRVGSVLLVYRAGADDGSTVSSV